MSDDKKREGPAMNRGEIERVAGAFERFVEEVRQPGFTDADASIFAVSVGIGLLVQGRPDDYRQFIEAAISGALANLEAHKGPELRVVK